MFTSNKMHSLFKRAVVWVLALAVVGSFGGTASARQDDNSASVSGSGESFQPGFQKYFTFSATQTSSKTLAAKGKAKVRQNDNDFSFRARVTCLRIEGNQAVIGLLILKGDGSAASQAGNAIRLFVTDGKPTNDPDRFDNSGYEAAPANCSLPINAQNGTVREDGDITIRHGDANDD